MVGLGSAWLIDAGSGGLAQWLMLGAGVALLLWGEWAMLTSTANRFAEDVIRGPGRRSGLLQDAEELAARERRRG